jgi:uncharacterized DUF497 family protein
VVKSKAGPVKIEQRRSVVREDRRQDYGEDRFILLGMVQEHLLVVSYTMRGERVLTFSFCACPVRKTGAHPGTSPGQAFSGTCAISARLAGPRERRRYHEENDEARTQD